LKRAKVPNLVQAAKSELMVSVKWRVRTSIPSIHAPRLPMGPKYNVETCVEELGCTISYWRSKHLLKNFDQLVVLSTLFKTL